MTAKSHERRVIVVGGSIAGLFVGAFLRRIGWRVDIYERSSIELIGRGVGIFATHLELFEALDKCGAGTVDVGVIVYKRITFDREGSVIGEKPQLQIVTSWDRLRQVLLKANDRQRYHFGHMFDRVDQDGSAVQVYFANGRSECADLLVGCDGFRSSVRAYLAPEVQPIYSGYYIWRGAPKGSDLSPETRRTMFPYFSERGWGIHWPQWGGSHAAIERGTRSHPSPNQSRRITEGWRHRRRPKRIGTITGGCGTSGLILLTAGE